MALRNFFIILLFFYFINIIATFILILVYKRKDVSFFASYFFPFKHGIFWFYKNPGLLLREGYPKSLLKIIGIILYSSLLFILISLIFIFKATRFF